jgi:lysophospholipid hydrolase
LILNKYFNVTFLNSDLLDSDPLSYTRTTQANQREETHPQPISSSFRRRHHGATPTSTNSVEGEGEINLQLAGFYASTAENDQDSGLSLKQALHAFKISLGLEDTTSIKDLIHLREVPIGTFLAKEESNQLDCGLVYILSGTLTLTQRENEREVLMFNAHCGEFVGALAVLTGEPSIFTIKAKHHSRVAVMSSSEFYS